MIDRIACSVGGTTTLLFGPQALSFDANALHQIRTTVLKTEDHRWILDTIAGLPECLENMTKYCSKFSTESRSRLSLLEDLDTWFRTGASSQQPSILPNILLSHLVIIAQLIQYAEYLATAHPDLERGEDLYASSKHDAETLGFCTGLLSAFAVSSSTNKKQFEKYGAVAIRLGMLTGMVVDAQNTSEETGPSTSFATVWHSVGEKEKMSKILAAFPEVSCTFKALTHTLANSACRHTSQSFMMKIELL